MDSSQIHLALTHVPVILSIVGLVILAVAMVIRNDTVTKTSFYILLFAGVFAIPVFFTGEGAEEIVERLPGVSDAVIEKHEELATWAFIAVSGAAVTALAGLLLFKNKSVLRMTRPFVFLLSVLAAATMAVTAHLGGQVRHTEIRSDFAKQSEKVGSGDMKIMENEDKD